MKKLEAVTNVVIIAVAALAAVVLVRDHMPPSVPPQVKSGDRLTLAGVDWSAHSGTLVLALQTGCRYCTESAPFYARLTGKLAEAGINTVAVLPDPTEQSQEYLKRMNVRVQDIRQGVFHDLKVRATPTLILVDHSGMVRNIWVGKLESEREREVVESALAMRGS